MIEMHELKNDRKPSDDRPKEVGLAIKLLLTSLLTGMLAGFLKPIKLAENVGQIAFFEILVLILLFNGYIYYSLSLRRNWARLLFIILTVAGLPLTVTQWPHIFLQNPLSGVVGMITTLIQLAAVYLLFQKSSKDWFIDKK